MTNINTPGEPRTSTHLRSTNHPTHPKADQTAQLANNLVKRSSTPITTIGIDNKHAVEFSRNRNFRLYVARDIYSRSLLLPYLTACGAPYHLALLRLSVLCCAILVAVAVCFYHDHLPYQVTTLIKWLLITILACSAHSNIIPRRVDSRNAELEPDETGHLSMSVPPGRKICFQSRCLGGTPCGATLWDNSPTLAPPRSPVKSCDQTLRASRCVPVRRTLPHGAGCS
jgi:hypothetical protein